MNIQKANRHPDKVLPIETTAVMDLQWWGEGGRRPGRLQEEVTVELRPGRDPGHPRAGGRGWPWVATVHSVLPAPWVPVILSSPQVWELSWNLLAGQRHRSHVHVRSHALPWAAGLLAGWWPRCHRLPRPEVLRATAQRRGDHVRVRVVFDSKAVAWERACGGLPGADPGEGWAPTQRRRGVGEKRGSVQQLGQAGSHGWLPVASQELR